MIVLDVEQGTEAWHTLRLGRATASQFGKILTPKTMALSKQSDDYLNELLCGLQLGEPIEHYRNQAMQDGNDYEDRARSYYQFMYGPVEQVGFVLRDDRFVGCSPDGLCGTDGGLEIKVPTPTVQMKRIRANLRGDLTLPPEYIPQVQGNMMVCERQCWDWLSFRPDMDPVLLHVERDDEYITKLKAALDMFVERLQKEMKVLGLKHIDVPADPDTERTHRAKPQSSRNARPFDARH